MRKILQIVAISLTPWVATAVGQEGSARPRGISSRLAEIVEAYQPRLDEEISLDDVGRAVVEALESVDAGEVERVNSALSHLRDEEAELEDLLRDLAQGLPLVSLAPVTAPDPVGDLAPDTLEMERRKLQVLRARATALEEQRRRDALAAQLEAAARRLSPFGEALLASLEKLPEANEAPKTALVIATPFTARAASALYLAGDYAGAARRFRSLDAATLTPRRLYQMARSLEEIGDLDGAVETLRRLEAMPDGFWQRRAKNLREFIEKSRSLESLLKEKD